MCSSGNSMWGENWWWIMVVILLIWICCCDQGNRGDTGCCTCTGNCC